jgi:hypothetical protein
MEVLMPELNNFLPKKSTDPNEALVQAKIPLKLRNKAFKILKARHLTWNDLIAAACKQLIVEEGQKLED